MALQGDLVSGEQYRYALQNFRIAHEKVEEQRRQLQEQERQVAELRAHIAVLEGDNHPFNFKSNETKSRQGGQSVDDFSIKNAASRLEKQISRWAADVIRTPPATLDEIRDAAMSDLGGSTEGMPLVTQLQVQNLLRHALSETISEGIINCLIITNSTEANVQLTRIHEHLFARDPTVACVWRRQTFSTAVDSCSPEMSEIILRDSLPALLELLSLPYGGVPPVLVAILDAAFGFSRMLHGSKTGAGGKMDAFYKAFVPELGTPLDPYQVELVKRCLKTESGDMDHVGSCIFPGLVKTTGRLGPNASDATSETVMKRALVMCECALGIGDQQGPIGRLRQFLPSPPPAPPASAFSPPPNNGVHPDSYPSDGIPLLPNPHTALDVSMGSGQYPTEAMDGLTLVQPRS